MGRWHALRRILALFRPQTARLGVAFACMLVLALGTGAYAYLTGPLLTFLLSGGSTGLGAAGKLLPGLAGHLDRAHVLLLFPILLVGVGLVKGGAYLGQFFFMGMVGQHAVADLRRALFTRFMGLSPGAMAKHHSGDLLSRFSSDVAAIEVFATYGLASMLRDTTQIAVLWVVALALQWKLALLTLAIVPLSALPVAKLARALRRGTLGGQQALGRLSERVQEGLWGHRVIQAYAMQPLELSRFDAESANYVAERKRAIWAKNLSPSLLEVGVVGALAGTLALAGHAVAAHQLAPAALVSFITVMALLYQPAKDLGRVSPWWIQAQASAERIFEILDADDPLPEAPSAQPLPPMQRALALCGVHFAYGDAQVLNGLDLCLKKGERVGLVGESGGGKSTVVKLVLRFLDPTSGAVTVDGRDLRTASLCDARAQCALVTQETLLFSDTVRANIAYGRPSASDTEVEASARQALAHDFIEALPQGYQTPIGERGLRLSGGQKQRLALARALLVNAPVLVLDEATSGLDPESEQGVQAALDAALVGRTALVVAHRLSAVRTADRICVLEGGRITEQGTHAELVSQGGTYARIAALQGMEGPDA